MIRRLFTFAMAICLTLALNTGAARAQSDSVYIQLEARTSLAGAEASVRRLSQRLADVNGFSLGGGWYGIALGPFSREQAQTVLNELRAQGAIPADSYIEENNAYGRQFWPVGAQAERDIASDVVTNDDVVDPAVVPDAAAPVVVADPVPVLPAAPEVADVADPVVADPVIVDEPEETVAEARRSERDLSRNEKLDLQIALQWAGFYNAAIDAAFGRGTRNAMAAWQGEKGFEPTGVLTTRQRAVLLRDYNAVLDGMDMARVTDARTGVSMDIPTGVVAFDRYEAPFAIFSPSGDLAARVLLISQPGNRKTMNGLYEIMQTLEIVPLEGKRERKKDRFLLTGANSKIVSHTEVRLIGGALKGFTLIWPAGDDERRDRVLSLMKKSFERIDGVLDPALVSDSGQSVDLVSGLRVRKPKVNASGFFIDPSGIILTSAIAVGQCDRVTVNGVHEAEVVAVSNDLGVAVLRPEDRLAPRRVVQFSAGTPRLQSEIAVAGFSFGGVLGAPSLTFGTLEDLKGLAGEETIKRLALDALPGDVGGPIFDAGGGVVGLLLPRQDGSGRKLPDQVSFAAKGQMIMDFLQSNGIRPSAVGALGSIAPEDLTALAADTTVLVGCWE